MGKHRVKLKLIIYLGLNTSTRSTQEVSSEIVWYHIGKADKDRQGKKVHWQGTSIRIVPSIGAVLPKRDGEQVISSEHLSETTVVRNKRGHDAKISSSLAEIFFFHQEACTLFHEHHANRTSKKGKARAQHSLIANTMNVNVRKKNRALSPIDLRSEPILWEAREEATHSQRPRQINDGDRHYSQEQECDNHPGKQVDPEGVIFHTSWSVCVGIANPRVGDEQGREGEPERAIGGERCTGAIVSTAQLNRGDGPP